MMPTANNQQGIIISKSWVPNNNSKKTQHKIWIDKNKCLYIGTYMYIYTICIFTSRQYSNNYSRCLLNLWESLISFMVYSFCHQIYYIHIKLNKWTYFHLVQKKKCRKRTINIIQVIHKSKPVCVIEMSMQKIMSCGFGFYNTRTKRI